VALTQQVKQITVQLNTNTISGIGLYVYTKKRKIYMELTQN